MQALSLPLHQKQVLSSPARIPVITPEREIGKLFRPSVFVGAKVYRSHKNRLALENFFDQSTGKYSLVLPLNVDSEFQTQSALDVFDCSKKAEGRTIGTLQVSDALNLYPSVFAHPDLKTYAQKQNLSHLVRHTVADSEFIAIDYLRSQGFEVKMIYNPDLSPKMKTFHVVLYGFFMVVDIYTYFQGQCLSLIEEAILKKQLLHQRHFQYISETEDFQNKKMRLPYEVAIDGHSYALTLDFVDLVGAQGKVSFKDFCQNVNMPLLSKDLADENKHRMVEWYFENPKDYDAYAVGDLAIYPAWREYVRYVNDLSAKVATPDYAIDPSLTIGSTTNKILDSKRLEYLELPSAQRYEPLYECYLGKSVFKELDDESNPAHTQLKVDGGRCHNNSPTTAKIQGALCDIDISGAYTSAMMYLLMFFGTPSVVMLEQNLEKVYKKYRSRLLPYHWTMRVSTKENLSFNQDIFPSFFDYRWKERKSDTESYHQSGELDYESGVSKIFLRQIINGMLTSDLLDLVLHTWTAKAREEFFSKVKVHSLVFYDPKLEMKDKDAFTYRLERDEYMEIAPTYWHAVPLSILGIEALRELRKQYPKGVPMNVLYKLFGNTSYGAIVSHFFNAQNPVTANNITAHIRGMVYLTEKALGLYQTITDGGIFNLNEVFTPKRKRTVFTDKLYDCLTLSKRSLDRMLDLKKTGLGGHHWQIQGDDLTNLTILCDGLALSADEAKQKVNTLCLQHLKSLFSSVPFLQNPHLAFEMKDFFNGATFHGSSNYGFWNDQKRNALKMRGYENKKTHYACGLDENGGLIPLTTYADELSPAQVMHDAIFENPECVPLNPPFIKGEILKTGSYVHLQSKWSKTLVRPGDNFQKRGIAKWFTMNQFTFQTEEQFNHWQKAADHLLRKYKIAYEMFGLNKDSTLNYLSLIKKIHKLVTEGVGCKGKDEILDRFDPHRNRKRLFSQNSRLVLLKESQRVLKNRLSEFYDTNQQVYGQVVDEMDQDVLDDMDGIYEENLK